MGNTKFTSPNVIKFVFSLTIILNLKGQKLKKQYWFSLSQGYCDAEQFQGPTSRSGSLLVILVIFYEYLHFLSLFLVILSSSSHFPPHRHKSQFDVVYGCLCCECISEASQTTKKIFLKELQLFPRTEISSSQFLLLSLPFQYSCIAPFSDLYSTSSDEVHYYTYFVTN